MQTPPTSASGNGVSTLRPDIQALRAIAVLAVLGFHSGLPLPGGFFGVDVFFVISGFVISQMLIKNYADTGKFSLKAFVWRRFWRLYPALAGVTIFTAVAGIFVLSPAGTLPIAIKTGLFALVGLSNFSLSQDSANYFAPSSELNPLLHTWSLSIEEQFYLGLALLLVLFAWLSKRSVFSQRIFFVALGATGLSLLVTLTHAELGWLADSHLVEFYSPLGRAWEFGFGALLGSRSSRWPSDPAQVRISPLIVAVGLIMMALSFFIDTGRQDFPNVWTLLPVVGVSLVLLGGEHGTISFRKLAEWRPLQTIGNASYSIYLWHWPLIVFVSEISGGSELAKFAAALVSIPIGYLSFRFIEQRWRHGNEISAPKDLGKALGWFVGTITAVSGVWIASSLSQTEALRSALEVPPGYALGCHGPDLQDGWIATCEWDFSKEGSNNRSVYLVGDSNAAHLAPGLMAASEASNWRLVSATASACPPAPNFVPNKGNDRKAKRCDIWQEQLLKFLESEPPGEVILAWSSEYFREASVEFWIDDQSLALSRETRYQVFERSVHDLVARLEDAGHQVHILAPIPHWFDDSEWSLSSCSLWDLRMGCNLTQSTGKFRAYSEDDFAVLEEVTSQTASQVINLVPLICPEGSCQTFDGTNWVYRDATHLTNHFSQSVSDYWRSWLSKYE